jgi:endonuclease/exonuclease/phosphatase family metal-dependent hydrolase
MSQAATVKVYRTPEPRRFQALLVAIGLLALFPGIAAAVLYLIPPTDDASAMSASFIPYGMLADLISLVAFGIAFVRARQRLALGLLAGLSALLLILQLGWISPQFVADDRPPTGAQFTLISLNLTVGRAAVDQLRRQAAAADVVVLVEVTENAYLSVSNALRDRFPYRTPPNADVRSGSMILSRFPMSEVRSLDGFFPQVSAATTVPGLGAVNVVATHPCNPFCDEGLWSSDHQKLLERADQLKDTPTVIAGDFNATRDHGPIRRLVDHGFTSGTDIVGAGWQPTFPTEGWLPPMIEIDHVLVNPLLTVTSIHTFEVPGADHLGLVARLAKAS